MIYLETIRIENNIVHNIEYHSKRMALNTTAALPQLNQLNSILEGRVKCRIRYNETDILSVEFSPYSLPKIESLTIIEAPNIVYNKKYENREELNTLFAQRMDADDILICRDGVIGDTYFCNLIFVNSAGELHTSDSPILKGTKCQSLIDKGVVKECCITTNELRKYEGAYLVNAMIDIQDGIYIDIKNINHQTTLHNM